MHFFLDNGIKVAALALFEEETSVYTCYNMKNVLHSKEFQIEDKFAKKKGQPFEAKKCDALCSSRWPAWIIAPFWFSARSNQAQNRSQCVTLNRIHEKNDFRVRLLKTELFLVSHIDQQTATPPISNREFFFQSTLFSPMAGVMWVLRGRRHVFMRHVSCVIMCHARICTEGCRLPVARGGLTFRGA